MGTRNVRGLLPRNWYRLSRSRCAPGPDKPAADVVGLGERGYLGEYLDRANIESNMQTVLHNWALYQAAKQKRSA